MGLVARIPAAVGGIAAGLMTVVGCAPDGSDESVWESRLVNPSAPPGWYGGAIAGGPDGWEVLQVHEGDLAPLNDSLSLGAETRFVTFEEDDAELMRVVAMDAGSVHEIGFYVDSPTVVDRFEMPFGSKPWDVVSGPGGAAMSLAGLGMVLTWGPFDDGEPVVVSLDAFADADGDPDLRTLALRGERLWATLHRTDGVDGAVVEGSALVSIESVGEPPCFHPVGPRPELHVSGLPEGDPLLSVEADGGWQLHWLGDPDDAVGAPVVASDEVAGTLIGARPTPAGDVLLLLQEGPEAVLTCVADGLPPIERMRVEGVGRTLHQTADGLISVALATDAGGVAVVGRERGCDADFEIVWGVETAAPLAALAVGLVPEGP